MAPHCGGFPPIRQGCGFLRSRGEDTVIHPDTLPWVSGWVPVSLFTVDRQGFVDVNGYPCNPTPTRARRVGTGLPSVCNVPPAFRVFYHRY
jgi:hypothetical protein